MKARISPWRMIVGAVLAAAFAWPWMAQAETTLRIVPQADLKILDTVFTTANITSNHGYMIYDMLFSLDANLVPQPQMVESYERSDDGLLWKFTLRDNLRFHDGSPVEGKDVAASIKRWAARMVAGQTMMSFADDVVATGPKTFEIRFKKPFGPVLNTLASPENPLFIHREKEALTDPHQQITEAIGSGPFKFVRDEWQPGNKVVYVKNEDYVPRDEPPSGFAGGKVAKVDRVEWIYIPDQNTAVQALVTGEVDMIEIPPADFLPILQASPDITVKVIDRIGTQAIMRPNHLIPPFDKPEARRALLYLVGDQSAYLAAMIGNPDYEVPCWAVFVCGTPLESKAGIGDWATNDRATNVAKAKELFKEAGYDGRPVVLMDPTDAHLAHAQVLVTAQNLRDAGVNVDVQALDWSTMVSRRPVKDPPEKGTGGWNLFHTWSGGLASNSPLTNTPVPTPCDQSNWFGWPCDEELEKIRLEFFTASTPEEQKAVVDRLQERFYQVVPYLPVGQFLAPIAYRNNLSGVLDTARLVLWNIEKH
jgi:peptide/nickel transport system substrate-binding protein